ncbi:hypothetical protein ANO11243_029870 [Dothideomycetidae sp. 11243]|uniref:Acyl-CoA ligase frbB n=1 Tax=Dothideomycetidae sp. (strain 11243) TaxID=1603295 RepID=FRBC_DOTX1|nr:RecName: Full=Acyl-CoA ligase frbB; AltName: Full=FR901469 biosynthesis cluster protein B [fungal sp. No.11243]GAM84984.1 hypothetical protein ANO11243_029870 [fungal sp. No.11243]
MVIFKSPLPVGQHQSLEVIAPVGELALNVHLALAKQHEVKPPFIDVMSGKAWHAEEIRDRVDHLARVLAKQFGWQPNVGTPWDKVVAIYSYNTVDFIILSWAVHRLGGLCLLLHSTSSAGEIAAHLKRVQCAAIFTNEPLLATTRKARELLNGEPQKIFILDVANELLPEGHVNSDLTTVEQLAQKGAELEALEPLKWDAVNGRDQVAYLCPTSGTSGAQKLAKVTHGGLLANAVQTVAHELKTNQGKTEVGLNFLPCSHIYGMMLSHTMATRGDCMVLHPFFDLKRVLGSIARFRIERLYLVPSIISALTRNPFLLDMVDLSSVTSVVTGAAPFGSSLADGLHTLRPKWHLQPGWGLTEGGGASSLTPKDDFVPGSSGVLLPLTEVRLIGEDGKDAEGHEVRGEIYMKSPSVIAGYLEDANTQNPFTEDGWLRTGDIGMFKVSPKGVEHLWVVDRVKDMIKVKGMQVAPAELEAHLLLLPQIAEVAVIGVADKISGERPKAFIVQAKNAGPEEQLRETINQHVEATLSEPHWLGKRIEFVNDLPKTSSGKAMKSVLRAKA